MGFLRKTILIGTGGLAPIKANSKKDRAAKAAEKQLRVQRQMLAEQRAANARTPVAVVAPKASAAATENLASAAAGVGFQVILTAPGARKIAVIKVVREFTRLGLKEAKAMVDNAPTVIADNVSSERAHELRGNLERVGGVVEMEALGEHESTPPAGQSGPAADEIKPGTLTEELERLAALHDRGVLTDDEFTAAKQRVLRPDPRGV